MVGCKHIGTGAVVRRRGLCRRRSHLPYLTPRVNRPLLCVCVCVRVYVCQGTKKSKQDTYIRGREPSHPLAGKPCRLSRSFDFTAAHAYHQNSCVTYNTFTQRGIQGDVSRDPHRERLLTCTSPCVTNMCRDVTHNPSAGIYSQSTSLLVHPPVHL